MKVVDRHVRVVPVLLAGPYPKEGGMTGTFGRILGNLRDSIIFRNRICFTPHRLTLPQDGRLLFRVFSDIFRGLLALRKGAAIIHVVMQYKRSLYREYFLLRFSKLLGIKTVMDLRTGALQRTLDHDNNFVQNFMMRNLFRKCDVILVECRSDISLVEKRYGRKPLNIPNVVLESEFKRVQPATLLLNPGEPLRIVYSGRYTRGKGILEALAATDILSAKGWRVELHLTGSGDDIHINKTISRYKSGFVSGVRVFDHGWDVPDLLEFLASMHVFILPTSYPNEGHPSSLTEGMTAGLGLVLSRWKHLVNLIPEGGAVIVDPNPYDIARGVEHFLTHPEALQRAGQLNRKHVADHFLDTVAYPHLLRAYQSIA